MMALVFGIIQSGIIANCQIHTFTLGIFEADGKPSVSVKVVKLIAGVFAVQRPKVT